MNNLYENTHFKNDRNRKQTLIIDVDDTDDIHLGSGTDFKLHLHEPLRIDKESEIYLDNFITYNCNISDTKDTSAFSLKINEFNIQSNVASSHNKGDNQGYDSDILHNSIIIPNEHTNINDNHSVIIHKGKKFNYVCDINPTTLHYISGKITNIAGKSIFHGHEIGNQYTYSLIGITDDLTEVTVDGTTAPSNVTLFPLTPNDVITGFSAYSSSSLQSTSYDNTISNASVLGYLFTNSGTFNFSASDPFALSNLLDISTDNSIVFRIARGGDPARYLKITYNTNMDLIKSNGRFLAEFCIISKD